MEYILTVVGLVIVTLGADWVVGGSSAIAKRAGLSDFVIGLTVVALGTSLPEMVVSFRSAFQGNADIAIGNVVGSNVFNTAVILGLTALLSPVAITARNRRFDMPANAGSTALLLAFALLGPRVVARWEGLAFLALFVAYFSWNFRMEKKGGNATLEESAGEKPSLVKGFALTAVGLAALVWGGGLFVDGAKGVARLLGWSDKVVAVTVIAAGTSLPELATSVVAAVKGRGQMALGNLIGSNTFNILLILGGSAVISPLKPVTVTSADFVALGLITVLMFVTTNVTSNDRVSRTEGAFLLLAGIAYMAVSIIL